MTSPLFEKNSSWEELKGMVRNDSCCFQVNETVSYKKE